MKIIYENTFLDIYLFNFIHQFKSIVVQSFFLLMAFAIIAVELKYASVNTFELFITGLVFYIFLWLIQIIFNLFYLYSKKDKAILTKHTLEIQNDALYEETKYNRSYFYWNGINKIVRIPGFVAVYITKHMAHIIPFRAFPSEIEREKFIELLKNKKLNS